MRPSVFNSLLTMLVVASFTTLGAQAPAPVEALDGVDPVLLLKTGKETFGRAAFKSERGRFTYLFASAESKTEFDANPERYAIQLNGVCARMGVGTGNPSNYAIANGKIYIFASDDCHKAFVAAPERFLPKPAAPLPSDPRAATAGKALLDRAAATHGGAKLDGLTSYAESYLPVTVNPMPSPPKVSTTFRFPDGVRSERTFDMSGKPMTIVTVLADGGGWGGPADAPQLRPLNPVSLPGIEQQMGRLLVPLLRNRSASGTKVASLGPATVNGAAVERVRLVRGAVDVTVNIEPASGRVHSVSAIDRGPESAFGEVVVVLSDFRDVDGILVPFKESATFDGVPAPNLSRSLESVVINPPVDPASFKGGAR